jgi:hypothetical protein
MEDKMRQLLAIVAAAIGLALLGSATCAGCAIGRDYAALPEAMQLLVAHRAQPDIWIVDGVDLIPSDIGSISTAAQPEDNYPGCWFDVDLPRCEQP